MQVRGTNLTASQSSALQRGMDQWNNQSCNTGGRSFPRLQQSAQGAGRIIDVTFISGLSPNGTCGSFAGNLIKVYELARLPDGRVVPCGRSDILEDTFAHELGHLLGLDDQYGSGCSTHIMGQATITSSGQYVQRAVKPGECQKVADTNETPQEQVAVDCLVAPDCQTPPSCPNGNPQLCSPIVLDLDRQGFEFTS